MVSLLDTFDFGDVALDGGRSDELVAADVDPLAIDASEAGQDQAAPARRRRRTAHEMAAQRIVDGDPELRPVLTRADICAKASQAAAKARAAKAKAEAKAKASKEVLPHIVLLGSFREEAVQAHVATSEKGGSSSDAIVPYEGACILPEPLKVDKSMIENCFAPCVRKLQAADVKIENDVWNLVGKAQSTRWLATLTKVAVCTVSARVRICACGVFIISRSLAMAKVAQVFNNLRLAHENVVPLHLILKYRYDEMSIRC